jgi:hypothetical protein
MYLFEEKLVVKEIAIFVGIAIKKNQSNYNDIAFRLCFFSYLSFHITLFLFLSIYVENRKEKTISLL